MATLKDSRYAATPGFTPAQDRDRVFTGIRPRRIDSAVPVLEHIVREGDRLDLLALHYYNDTRRWWRIVDANPEIVFGNDLVVDGQEGSIILIPRAFEPGGAI